MAFVKIYGASDDLVEVEGDLREEFDAYGDDGTYLHFSDGTVVHAAYDSEDYSGKWKVAVVRKGGSSWKYTPAPDDEDNYSDVLELNGPIEWVEAWSDLEPDRHEIIEKVKEIDWDEMDLDNLRKVLAMRQRRG